MIFHTAIVAIQYNVHIPSFKNYHITHSSRFYNCCTENGPDGTVCNWLFPTENGDNSGGCARLGGLTSPHNRVISWIEEKLMSYLNKRRAEGE